MELLETEMIHIAVTSDEIDLIISGLEISYHEWGNQASGALVHQFEEIKKGLDVK